MRNTKNSAFKPHYFHFLRRASTAVMAATMLLGSYGNLSLPVTAAVPLQISQNQQGWDTVVQLARLVDVDQRVTALVVQLDVLNKPATSYANAVYQLYARREGKWMQVYTSTGARLISNSAGQVNMAPEVITLDDLRKRLGNDVNFSDLEFQSVVLLRYDLPGGVRDQSVRLEQTQAYGAIAQTTSTQLVRTSTSSTQVVSAQTTRTTTVTSQSSSSSNSYNTSQNSSTGQWSSSSNSYNTSQNSSNQNTYNTSCDSGYVQVGDKPDPHRGHFTLAIRQQRVTVPEVIARVSLMAKRPEGYLREHFVGDFRYKMNQEAKFIRGLNEGDRVVVRLFSVQRQLIGYSEFELLPDNTAVNLILSDQPTKNRVVRTVYGIDADENGSVDQNKRAYDYFTEVTGDNLEDSKVVFFSKTQKINFGAFEVKGIPAVQQNAVYSCSFREGNFLTVNRTFRVFSADLAPALIALPGDSVQITSLNVNSLTVYEVSRQILVYKEVGITRGSITRIDRDVDIDYDNDNDDDDEDDNDDDKDSKQSCNQGIGNGAEGCDPGNSNPHGGSNDEGGRTPGGGNKPK